MEKLRIGAFVLLGMWAGSVWGMDQAGALEGLLMDPPERIEEAMTGVGKYSPEKDLAVHMSILATRLWEGRRYADARVAGEAALKQWEVQLSGKERSAKETGAIHFEMAHLNLLIFQDKGGYAESIALALEADPQNARYRQAQRRQSQPVPAGE